MKLVFLGTASHFPSAARGVSATALELDNGDIWLFDCGEGTQVQIQKSSIKAENIRKVFITHLHGDHLFGLPGLLFTISNQLTAANFEMEIYGPKGLRMWINKILDLCRDPIKYTYRIIEMNAIPKQIPEEWNDEGQWPLPGPDSDRLLPNEQEPRVVHSDQEAVWNLFHHEHFSVKASWLHHRVPCWGFSVQELSTGKISREIGRKVVILGDTQDSSAMTSLSRNCDVLVHEATLDDSLRSKAIENGHSTPTMAVEFAKSVACQRLVLTHFSQRYVPLGKDYGNRYESVQVILNDAEKAMGDFPCRLHVAHDLMELNIDKV